jgi:hypothetical protein
MTDAPDPELFREVFGRFATGVAVVTSAADGGLSGGMTANALCSLSLDPLLALVCFENRARTLPIVRDAGRFAVNLLSGEQERLAGVFASKLPEAEKLDLRTAGADRRRRPHDRDRAGPRAGPRRRRTAAVVRRDLPRARPALGRLSDLARAPVRPALARQPDSGRLIGPCAA